MFEFTWQVFAWIALAGFCWGFGYFIGSYIGNKLVTALFSKRQPA